MKIQEFQAETTSAALKKVQEQLGSSALILSTKSAIGGVVVTAALAEPSEIPQKRSKNTAALSDSLEELKSEIADLRETLSSGVPDSLQRIPSLGELDRRLRENGFSPRLRRRLIEASAKDGGGLEVFARAESVLAEWIPIWPSKGFEKKPRIVSFVGPTGAGKTTTLAKLAGRLVHEAKKKVALITLDTYRVAAVEQIRAYADMIGVPLQVVFTPADATRAITDFKEHDVVLIDTAGRSPFDADRLRELAGFVQSGNMDVLLALAANTSPDVAEEVLDRFATVGPSALVITKMDETKKPAALLDVILARDLPLAYVTDGQEVPADLERASAEKLAARMLENSQKALLESELSL